MIAHAVPVVELLQIVQRKPELVVFQEGGDDCLNAELMAAKQLISDRRQEHDIVQTSEYTSDRKVFG
jgi:hypothetical protein